MLQAVLNTEVYLGDGRPYTTKGSVVYEVPWHKSMIYNFEVTSINFYRSLGDAGKTRISIYDSLDAVKPVYSEEISFRALYSCSTPIHSSEGRLYIELRAMDGKSPNHAKIVIRGKEIEAE
ncbi:MAG: hypothetical protein MJA83_16680 [Gammaproteobacteria bacterium]|nr:hypothetical protein [Gammaproteobacteria bacterium]